MPSPIYSSDGYVYQLVVDDAVWSIHVSLELAQDMAEALMPQRRGMQITAVPTNAPGPSKHWRYDYASREWVQK